MKRQEFAQVKDGRTGRRKKPPPHIPSTLGGESGLRDIPSAGSVVT